MLTTVDVTVLATGQNGVPISGARISAILTRDDVDPVDGYVIAEKQEVTADAAGRAVLPLWPNALGTTESQYLFTITNPDNGATRRITATIPNSDCYLSHVANLPPYPGKSDGQLIIDAAVAAVAPAVAAQMAAEAAAASVIDAAAATIDAADETFAARDTVLAALASVTDADGNATGSASAAALSATDAADSATAAGASASSADIDAMNAGIYAGSASASANIATGAETDAANARDASINARDEAVAARDVSVTARDVSINARNDAIEARDLALGAKDSATTSAGAAASSASAAAGSASAATSRAGEAAASASSAEASRGAAVTARDEAVIAGASAVSAATSAAYDAAAVVAAALNVDAANAANADAQLALAGTASAATQAANARDQAVTASQVATAGNEALAGIAAKMHHGAIVKSFLYRTELDSDAGAWRKRTTAASWYNEAINGKWLGQAANELAARGDNLLTLPEELDNAGVWGRGGAISVSADRAISLDGTTTLELVAKNNIAVSQQLTRNVAYVAGGVYAFRAVAKAANLGGKLGMRLQTTYPARVDAVFDLIAGTVAYSGANAWTGLQASIKQIAPGLYECVLIGCANATATGVIVIGPTDNATGGWEGATATLADCYIGQVKVNAVGALASTYAASPELVTNGGFDSAAGWTPDAGWSIANGVAKCTPDGATTQNLRSTVPLTQGKIYRATATVSGRTAGNAALYVSASLGMIMSTNGVHEAVFVAGPTTALNVQAAGTFDGSIDNVSVKEVTQLATPYVPYSQLSGSYYQNTTDGKYYALNATYGQTETFRGNSREFPATAAIIAEAGRVIVYDLAQVGCPMWMVIQSGGSTDRLLQVESGRAVTSVYMLNGFLLIGTSGNALFLANFIADRFEARYTGGTFQWNANIAQRHAAGTRSSVSGGAIANNNINDIACVVLPTAPIDPQTGLPVPTVAVASAGGVSVIKDSGVVVNSANTSSADRIGIDSRGCLMWTYSGHVVETKPISDLSAGFLQLGATAGVLLNNGTAYSDANKYLQNPLGIMNRVERNAAGGANGLVLHRKGNLASNSMLAAITAAYNSGWQVGDSRLATLCDIVPETITGSGELVTNGTFATDTAGWVAEASITATVSGGQVSLARNGSISGGGFQQTVATVAGKTYCFTFAVIAGTVHVRFGGVWANYSVGVHVVTFLASAAASVVNIWPASDLTAVTIDNVSVKLAEPDRSVKGNGLILSGTLQKTPVASGAQLVAYSGFSAANYLEQPYNSALDFGTGDFCVMGWATIATMSDQLIIDRGTAGAGRLGVGIISGSWAAYCSATASVTSTGVAPPLGLHFLALVRTAGVLSFFVDGSLIYTAANTANISNAIAKTTIGTSYAQTAPASGSLALWRASATASSPDQIRKIYADELQLFQPGAQCTIAGTSRAVTAMAYDEDADLLHVGTSWGRSSFQGLRRIDSEVSTVGAVTSLSAGGGAVLTGGAASGRFYQPAMYLRDELRRRTEARKALGQVPVFTEYDAIAAQTAFIVPKGYCVKAVYSAGVLKRIGATKDYLVSFDGFAETVTFAVAPGAAAWVSIMCIRSA